MGDAMARAAGCVSIAHSICGAGVWGCNPQAVAF
jgi:hypothetical protein